MSQAHRATILPLLLLAACSGGGNTYSSDLSASHPFLLGRWLIHPEGAPFEIQYQIASLNVVADPDPGAFPTEIGNDATFGVSISGTHSPFLAYGVVRASGDNVEMGAATCSLRCTMLDEDTGSGTFTRVGSQAVTVRRLVTHPATIEVYETPELLLVIRRQ